MITRFIFQPQTHPLSTCFWQVILHLFPLAVLVNLKSKSQDLLVLYSMQM